MNKHTKITFLTVFGAPVYIHWLALMIMTFIVVFSLKTPVTAVLLIVSYFGIILLHEFGHALFAHKLGCGVTRIGLDL